MAVSTIVKTKRDGTLTIKDGTGTPLELVIAYEQGDLNISIPGPTVNAYLDRGQFGATPALRYGDDQPITGTFTAYLRHPTDASDEVLLDLLTQSGQIGTNWVSTLGANAEVAAYTLVFAIAGLSLGDSANYSITCNHCVFSGSVGEGDPNSISVSFTSYDLYPTVA
jgi:hypothetical protein